MTEQFADTSYFVALLSSSDTYHGRALELTSNRAARLITTGFILIELGSFFRARQSRSTFVQLLDALSADSSCIILPTDQETFLRGFELYRDRLDKEWSLTDCISFVVMQDRGPKDALTSDHHFEQAGFGALLRREPGPT